jgi:hypothetical protein
MVTVSYESTGDRNRNLPIGRPEMIGLKDQSLVKTVVSEKFRA